MASEECPSSPHPTWSRPQNSPTWGLCMHTHTPSLHLVQPTEPWLWLSQHVCHGLFPQQVKGISVKQKKRDSLTLLVLFWLGYYLNCYQFEKYKFTNLPCSTIWPSCKTKIWSDAIIVDNLQTRLCKWGLCLKKKVKGKGSYRKSLENKLSSNPFGEPSITINWGIIHRT